MSLFWIISKDILPRINCRSLKDNSIRHEPAQCLRIMMRKQQLGADVYNSHVSRCVHVKTTNVVTINKNYYKK